MALIVVKKSPENGISNRLLKVALPSDTILLVQDGVLFAMDKDLESKVTQGVKLVALKEDFLARGFSEADSSIPLVDYNGWVELLEQNDKVIS
ncbi:MAG TPA: sulfurtransferase complex subunit TusB [Candidatus Deferrimicrobium sp.]|nr:sulfurtransferase complex subunit TusB [Candidatus Deferrimicrobium sp.]